MSYNPAKGFPRVVPELRYKDPNAAIEWLVRVFGFKVLLSRTGENGVVDHADLELETGIVMVGPWSSLDPARDQARRAPCQTIVFVRDVDAHFARSKGEGAPTLSEPRDKPWGLRQYLAEDLEGHVWEFTQHVRDVAAEAWGAVEIKP